MYKVTILPDAITDLKNIDKVVAQRIIDKIKWLSINIEQIIPESLTADLKECIN